MYFALLVLNVAVFALVVAAFLRSPACNLYHPLTIYLAFHGLVFVLRPLLSWYYDYAMIYELFRFAPDSYAKNMTLVAANVGLLSFAAASVHFGNAPFRNGFDKFTAIEMNALAKPLWLVSLLLLPLIAWSLYEVWQLRAASMETLQLDEATGTTINTVGNGYVQSAYMFGVTLMPLIAWVGRFRLWTLAPAVLFVFLQSGSGTRGPAISMLLCLALLYLHARNRKLPDWRVIGIAVAGLVLFNLVGSDRGHSIRSVISEDRAIVSQKDRRLAPLEGMDLGSLEYFEFLVEKVPRSTGTFEYFVDNLQIFTEPVPRVLWKGKPIGQPIRLFYLFNYGYPIGMTRSLPGEGWTQLGLIGVAVWCGLWGTICGWIYNRYTRSRQGVLQTAFYVSFLATLIVFYRDGLLITLLRQGVFFVLPALLWAGLARAMAVPRASDFRLMAAARQLRADRMAKRAAVLDLSEAAAEGLRRLPRSQRHARRPFPLPRR